MSLDDGNSRHLRKSPIDATITDEMSAIRPRARMTLVPIHVAATFAHRGTGLRRPLCRGVAASDASAQFLV
jgi:hypothetical protein